MSSWRRYEYGLSKLVVFVHTWEVEPFSKAFPGVEFHGVTDFHVEAVKHRFFVYKVGGWGDSRGGAVNVRGCKLCSGWAGYAEHVNASPCPRTGKGGLKQYVDSLGMERTRSVQPTGTAALVQRQAPLGRPPNEWRFFVRN